MNRLTTRSPGRTETPEITVRSVCLGNERLADDCLGKAVAGHIRQFTAPDVEVVSAPKDGFRLLDYVLQVRCLVAVDALVSGIPAGKDLPVSMTN